MIMAEAWRTRKQRNFKRVRTKSEILINEVLSARWAPVR